MKVKTPETKRDSIPPMEIGLKGGLRKAKIAPEPEMRKLSVAEQKELDASLLKFAKKKNWEAVEALLRRGAKDSAKDLFGYTALTYLAEEGKTELIRKLMFNGGRISIKERAARAGYIKATSGGHRETIDYFIKNSDFLDGKGGLPLNEREWGACAELLVETYKEWKGER